MHIRLFGLAPESIVDGPGIRMAIFMQGCLRKCEGCQNPGSWPLYGGEKTDTESIKKKIAADPLLRGITLSGGEPFLQPVAALELAKFAHAKGLDVWCYSGYTYEQITAWNDTRRDLLREIDVLVDGPFEKDKASMALRWRGSENQRVIDVKKSLEKGEVVAYDGE